jgi:hypothetical protein
MLHIVSTTTLVGLHTRIAELEVALRAANSATDEARIERATERNERRRERALLEVARKQMILMRREGMTLAPESTDEAWGRYSIDEEEQKMIEVQPATMLKEIEPDDEGDFDALIRRELAALDATVEASLDD